MDRSIPLLLIGLVFGGGIGFAIAAGNGITFDGHDHSDPSQHGQTAGKAHDHTAHGANHDHETLMEISGGGPVPTLDMELLPDPASGWNLHIMTTNFRFSPEHASLDPVPGEGHAHIYVNGDKLGRMYGAWQHLADLPDGKVTIEVTLNANDHRPLAVDGRKLSASATVDN